MSFGSSLELARGMAVKIHTSEPKGLKSESFLKSKSQKVFEANF